MDAYPHDDDQHADPTSPDSQSGELSPSGLRPPGPTEADLARWKDEADRFLDDVRRRLDDILLQIEKKQAAQPRQPPAGHGPKGGSKSPEHLPVPPQSEPSQTGPNVSAAEDTPALQQPPDSSRAGVRLSDDDRISALKAQLARKLHHLEEHTARMPEASSAAEIEQ